jgi:hypothetical protein
MRGTLTEYGAHKRLKVLRPSGFPTSGRCRTSSVLQLEIRVSTSVGQCPNVWLRGRSRASIPVIEVAAKTDGRRKIGVASLTAIQRQGVYRPRWPGLAAVPQRQPGDPPVSSNLAKHKPLHSVRPEACTANASPVGLYQPRFTRRI